MFFSVESKKGAKCYEWINAREEVKTVQGQNRKGKHPWNQEARAREGLKDPELLKTVSKNVVYIF